MVDAGANALQRALRAKGVAKRPRLFAKRGKVDAWGDAPASEHQEILVALASLIRAQRYEMALTILGNELEG